METLFAFALGVLVLLGSSASLALKVFVTALAIVDDLGAVLVIALFYIEKLSLTMLGVGAAILVAPALLGAALWVAFLKSGVHAAIAGVLLALTIPPRRTINARELLDRAELFMAEFREDMAPGRSEPTTDLAGRSPLVERAAESLDTPLARLEHSLHPMVAFFIMPVFALANAGVVLLEGNLVATLGQSVSLGIVLGLFLGKQAACWASSGWQSRIASRCSRPRSIMAKSGV